MDKQAQLKTAKRQALLWLCGAAVIFVLVTTVQVLYPAYQNSFSAGLIKMAAEAALIGGLADWFAVTALFKPIPARYPIPHTNIVARNKKAIAENLSDFVKEKFFNPVAIESLIASSHPAKGAGRWLKQQHHADKLARYLCDTLAGFLHVFDDAPVKQFVMNAIRKGINKVDLGPLASGTLTVLTRDGRHQLILDKLLHKLAVMSQTPETQDVIAAKLYQWLKTEHRRLEKILPSQWLSEQGANAAVKALADILADIDEDASHPLRLAFDRQVAIFAEQLENDPVYLQKLDDFRQQLLENDTLQHYLHAVWSDVKTWLDKDLADGQGRSHKAIASALCEIGNAVDEDPALAASIDKHIAEAGRYMAPELSDFLTSHIRKTIEGWDEKDMAQQIELNIGKDLQKVRINGTIVGGLIGGVLYFIEQGIGLLG